MEREFAVDLFFIFARIFGARVPKRILSVEVSIDHTVVCYVPDFRAVMVFPLVTSCGGSLTLAMMICDMVPVNLTQKI